MTNENKKEWITPFADDEAIKELFESFNQNQMQSIRPLKNGRLFGIFQSVGDIKGLKMEIFANEHPPPHFRVKYQNQMANFRITDCEKINGGLGKKEKHVKPWWNNNKQKLIDTWNRTRPSDCPVGGV